MKRVLSSEPLQRIAACSTERLAGAAAVFLILLTLLVALFSTSIPTRIIDGLLLDRTQGRIDAGLADQIDLLSGSMESAARLDSLRARLEAEDITGVEWTLATERQRDGLDTLFVVDTKGTVRARAEDPGAHGDNVLLKHPEIGAILDGAVISTYFADPEPSLIVGAPVRGTHGEVVGMLLGGYRLDARFAAQLKQRYFPESGQVAFFAGRGISGSSLEDGTRISTLLNRYFDIGTSAIPEANAHDRPEEEISVGDKYYPVRREILSPASGAGMLVFAEADHTALSTLLAAAIALFFFMCIAVGARVVRHERIRRSCIRAIAGATLIVFAICDVGTFVLLDRATTPLAPAPFPIYNSTMSIYPDSDVVTRGTEKTVNIMVHTGGEAINAMSANLRFDPLRMRVDEIVTDHSVCADGFFIEKSFDNDRGTIDVVCGIPTPGFLGASGVIADVLFTPTQQGEASITFASSTQVLANDGLGTDVLRQSTPASFLVTTGEDDVLFSDTHPNAARWYKDRTARFNWLPVAGSSYLYYFGPDPEGIPTAPVDAEHHGSLSVTADGDGVYYFRLARVQGDAALSPSTVKVMIDATPPALPDVRLDNAAIAAQQVLRMAFSSSDALSGLQNSYYVRIDKGVLLPVKSPMQFAFAYPGVHTITVRAFDAAGNWADAVRTVTVQ